MVTIPGGEGGAGAVGGSLAQIGQGGTGSDRSIPECPICHARGGGGHGGNCPNAGRPPSEWTARLPAGYLPAASHLPHIGGVVCVHCQQPIWQQTLLEFFVSEKVVGGQRPVGIWVHAGSSHERCEDRDTYAEPASEPARP